MDFDTQTNGDNGGSSSGGGGTPPATPGDEFNFSDPFQSFVRATRSVLLQPVGFFSDLMRGGDIFSPAVFALIWYEIAAVLGGLISLAFGSVSVLSTGGTGEQAAGSPRRSVDSPSG